MDRLAVMFALLARAAAAQETPSEGQVLVSQCVSVSLSVCQRARCLSLTVSPPAQREKLNSECLHGDSCDVG